jgi:hypothetical protein
MVVRRHIHTLPSTPSRKMLRSSDDKGGIAPGVSLVGDIYLFGCMVRSTYNKVDGQHMYRMSGNEVIVA